MSKKHPKTKTQILLENAKPYLKQYQGNKTRTAYRKNLRRFFVFCTSNGFKTTESIKGNVLLVQKYADSLIEQGYTPSTVHTYLAPVCGFCEISMKEIKKEKRKVSGYTRGRTNPEKKTRKSRSLDNPKYQRLVDFQKRVGIRRSELKKLTGKDFCYDKSLGFYYVFVRRGKGGKDQKQRILPEDVKFIKVYFENKKPDENIFSQNEMDNELNLHYLRAMQAKRAYQYYLDRLKIEDNYREKLRSQILARFIEGKKGFKEKLENNYRKTIRLFYDETVGIYQLRGDNKALAIRLGLPTEYDKLALMAVSVFHLSHWRNDVTVHSYMLAH